MTRRVFEGEYVFEVSDGTGCALDLDIMLDGVMITVEEDSGAWEFQRASFTMTAEEATLLKEFLIRKGY